ncbi:MAG: hypothetical protein KDC95_02805 [Planctomycetes bacterium]|nr:hypothetical protein [Planctomycetota bacterium]
MKNYAIATAVAFALSGAAMAQSDIKVTADIATSTTWTANNTYNLQKQIYVLPGATLTIQPGTIIASDTNVGGSLAVTRGAKIIAQGTAEQPIIFTSKADVATWTGNDPKTGAWRESANEWGNLTIMGKAYISEDVPGGSRVNSPSPSASNVGTMEGLTPTSALDPNVLYGGGDDNDDSGSLSHVSFRYGGKVIGLGNELNGLSLGGIGRGTDIDHVEIMNNVDDGIEIWGGTVNLKYVSIWNIGDDSFDIDQGWRGKAQFGLIVQGYSLDAKQGSGVGDNCFETDGAEQSDYQPVTTGAIYNFTAIGEPNSGDHGTAWRDNARVQYHNCVFMDLGDELVFFENIDGDGGLGYGYNGTLSWPATWTTNYNVYSTVNAPSNPAAFYMAQTSGKLAEMLDCVTYNNNASKAYNEATARGVFTTGNNNIQQATAMPIKALMRSAIQLKGGKPTTRVTMLDPRPAGDALKSVGFAPADGFFTPAQYRGGFAPGISWLNGWTASEAYGITPKSSYTPIDAGAPSTATGVPVLSGTGTLAPNTAFSFDISNAAPNTGGLLIIGATRLDLPFFGGILVPFPLQTLSFLTNANGAQNLAGTVPASAPGNLDFYMQAWIIDATGPQGFTATNGVRATRS